MIPPPFLRVSGSLIVRDSLVNPLSKFQDQVPPLQCTFKQAQVAKIRFRVGGFNHPFSKNFSQKLDHFPKLE